MNVPEDYLTQIKQALVRENVNEFELGTIGANFFANTRENVGYIQDPSKQAEARELLTKLVRIRNRKLARFASTLDKIEPELEKKLTKEEFEFLYDVFLARQEMLEKIFGDSTNG